MRERNTEAGIVSSPCWRIPLQIQAERRRDVSTHRWVTQQRHRWEAPWFTNMLSWTTASYTCKNIYIYNNDEFKRLRSGLRVIASQVMITKERKTKACSCFSCLRWFCFSVKSVFQKQNTEGRLCCCSSLICEHCLDYRPPHSRSGTFRLTFGPNCICRGWSSVKNPPPHPFFAAMWLAEQIYLWPPRLAEKCQLDQWRHGGGVPLVFQLSLLWCVQVP